MTTRFEQIAAAFPLHAQRIAELTFEHGGDIMLQWLHRRLDANWSGGDVLAGAFPWDHTSESFEYWRDLALGVP